jgi:UPF0271 protein
LQVILDASGFFAGLQNLFQRVITTSYVIAEVKDARSSEGLATAMSSGKIVIRDPSPSTVERVKGKLREMSEETLSQADISLIALALEMESPIVFTDDYSLQNVLMNLGIPFKPVRTKGITRSERAFVYVCKSCGRRVGEYLRGCPYCGGELKKVPISRIRRKESADRVGRKYR